MQGPCCCIPVGIVRPFIALTACVDVSRRSYVCTHQDLAPLAPQHQHQPEALCHLLSSGCICSARPGHVQGWVSNGSQHRLIYFLLYKVMRSTGIHFWPLMWKPSVFVSQEFTCVIPAGHRIEEIPEVPLVVDDKVEGYKKTKEAVLLLKKLKAWNDIKKVNHNTLGWILWLLEEKLGPSRSIRFAQYVSIFCIRYMPPNACVPVRVRWGIVDVSSAKDHASSTTKTPESPKPSEISQVGK